VEKIEKIGLRAVKRVVKMACLTRELKKSRQKF